MDEYDKGGWLSRERTFEELELPLELEAECMSDLLNVFDNSLPYMEELDPDAEYIKAVAAGQYRHGDPLPRPRAREGAESAVRIPVLDERARLTAFAGLMGWGGDDMTEEGYLKAVVQNKAGKATVIKDLIGIKDTDNEDV